MSSYNRLGQMMAMRGERLYEWRILSGRSQVGISRDLGVHPNTFRAWEAGNTVIPKEKIDQLISMGFPAKFALVDLH